MGSRVDGMRAFVFTLAVCGMSSCLTDIDVDEDDPLFPFAASYCAAFAECDCPGYPEQSNRREECEQQTIDAVGTPLLDRVRESHPGMEFAFDPACIEELEAWAEGLQCDGQSTHTTSCAAQHCLGNTVSGPLRAGERCEWQAECGPGLFCDRGPDGDDICIDLCAWTPSTVGGPCGAWGQECEDGLVCLAGYCAEPGMLGQPCAYSSCGDGLYCDDSCRPLLADDSACDSSDACESDRCVEGLCTSVQLGEPCELERNFCAEGLTCFEGECSELPLLCAR